MAESIEAEVDGAGFVVEPPGQLRQDHGAEVLHQVHAGGQVDQLLFFVGVGTGVAGVEDHEGRKRLGGRLVLAPGQDLRHAADFDVENGGRRAAQMGRQAHVGKDHLALVAGAKGMFHDSGKAGFAAAVVPVNQGDSGAREGEALAGSDGVHVVEVAKGPQDDGLFRGARGREKIAGKGPGGDSAGGFEAVFGFEEEVELVEVFGGQSFRRLVEAAQGVLQKERKLGLRPGEDLVHQVLSHRLFAREAAPAGTWRNQGPAAGPFEVTMVAQELNGGALCFGYARTFRPRRKGRHIHINIVGRQRHRREISYKSRGPTIGSVRKTPLGSGQPRVRSDAVDVAAGKLVVWLKTLSRQANNPIPAPKSAAPRGKWRTRTVFAIRPKSHRKKRLNRRSCARPDLQLSKGNGLRRWHNLLTGKTRGCAGGSTS